MAVPVGGGEVVADSRLFQVRHRVRGPVRPRAREPRRCVGDFVHLREGDAGGEVGEVEEVGARGCGDGDEGRPEHEGFSAVLEEQRGVFG